jgi:hypothetical protein
MASSTGESIALIRGITLSSNRRAACISPFCAAST